MKRIATFALGTALLALTGATAPAKEEPRAPDGRRFLSQPLVTEIYTADPSAHVFNGKIYVYPSHDIDGPTPEDDLGAHFEMRDYRVISMDKVGGKVTLHPVALDVKDVPWADRQMWAPDAAYKNGTYYLYFPAKDRQGAFRIGVMSPSGGGERLLTNAWQDEGPSWAS